MRLVADEALALTESAAAYVEQVVDSRETVKVVATAGTGAPLVGTRVMYPGSLTEGIIDGGLDGKLVTHEHIGRKIAPYLAESCKRCSAFVLPLMAEDEVLGALVVLYAADHPEPTAGEITWMHTIADLASLAFRRVRQMERIERDRARLAALLESAAEGVYGLDREGRCSFLNQSGVRMLGYEPGEVLGREMHPLIHHSHEDGSPHPSEQCPIQQTLRSGEVARVGRDVVWRKDGSPVPVRYTASPIVEEGEVTGAVVTFTDISEHVRRDREEAELRARLETERLLRASVLEQMPVGVAIVDAGSERIVYRNAAAVGLLEPGAPERHADAESAWHGAIHAGGVPYDAEEYPLARALRNGEVVDQEELIYRCANGALVHLAVSAAPVRDSRGRIVAGVSTFVDIAERKRLDEATRAAGAEAAAANRTKSEFLANMSHELRTPINAIVGYTELLDMEIAGPLTDKQRFQLGRIRASSQHLLGLVNEVLDLAKIESGQMKVERETGDLSFAARATIELMQPQAEARQLSLENHCRTTGHVEFVGDEQRVRQILLNLLSNAIKFTEPGGRVEVICGVAREPDPQVQQAGGEAWAYLSVIDTGIGIAPEQIARIFQPFVQVETGTTRSWSGTGLGLTISRQLAHLMGGDLSVHSAPGEGSRFTLWLPAGTGAVPSGAEPSRSPAAEAAPYRGFGAIGRALQGALDDVIRGYLDRVRADPLIPAAATLSQALLEDHSRPFLSGLAQALIVLEQGGRNTELLQTGSEIQRLIAERHGAQRARLGWTETALHREFEILREEIDAAARSVSPSDDDATTDRVVDMLHRFVEQAERTSRRGYRAAGAAELQ